MKTIDIVISYNLFCQFELIYTLFDTHFISLWTVNTLFDGFISKVILDPFTTHSKANSWKKEEPQ